MNATKSRHKPNENTIMTRMGRQVDGWVTKLSQPKPNWMGYMAHVVGHDTYDHGTYGWTCICGQTCYTSSDMVHAVGHGTHGQTWHMWLDIPHVVGYGTCGRTWHVWLENATLWSDMWPIVWANSWMCMDLQLLRPSRIGHPCFMNRSQVHDSKVQK